MKKESKTIHEAFSRFFENPTRETFRVLLKDHVGELRNCDFKESWPDHSSLARHVLGLGNSGGGCLVIGVKENEDKTTEPTGIESITDKADITNGIKNYIPSSLLKLVEIADFGYEASEYHKLVGKNSK